MKKYITALGGGTLVNLYIFRPNRYFLNSTVYSIVYSVKSRNNSVSKTKVEIFREIRQGRHNGYCRP